MHTNFAVMNTTLHNHYESPNAKDFLPYVAAEPQHDPGPVVFILSTGLNIVNVYSTEQINYEYVDYKNVDATKKI